MASPHTRQWNMILLRQRCHLQRRCCWYQWVFIMIVTWQIYKHHLFSLKIVPDLPLKTTSPHIFMQQATHWFQSPCIQRTLKALPCTNSTSCIWYLPERSLWVWLFSKCKCYNICLRMALICKMIVICFLDKKFSWYKSWLLIWG